MKKIIALLLTAIIVLAFSSCGDNGIAVPDVSGTESDTAKSLLSSNQLIPVIEEQYDDNVEAGIVISTSPSSGNSVPANSKVTVYVSKGPSKINSLNSTGHWNYISRGEDSWKFTNPYIEDGKLFIDCTISFAIATTWKDTSNKGTGFGTASISDTFEKTVPVTVHYNGQTHAAGEEQKVQFEIPVTDLDVQKPTTIYLQLCLENNIDVNCNFSITW